VSVCPSIRPSVTRLCSTEMAKHRSTQTTPHDSPGTIVFLVPKISTKLKRGHPNGDAKCRWSTLNAGKVAVNWRLLPRGVVNLDRSQVYDTEHRLCVLQDVCGDAACHAGLSVTPDCGFTRRMPFHSSNKQRYGTEGNPVYLENRC